jgi:hypothetical protein
MITPELKDFDCADIDDPATWKPDHDDVLYWLTIRIGQPGSDAADLFNVPVATPSGLKKRSHEDRRSCPAPPIVINPYSWESVLDEIERRLNSCCGHDWFTVQEKLRTQFHWEYEGMSGHG